MEENQEDKILYEQKKEIKKDFKGFFSKFKRISKRTFRH